MKLLLYFSTSILFLSSCSSSKEIAQTSKKTDYDTYQNQYYYHKSNDAHSKYENAKVYKPKNSTVVDSEKISNKVNKIINKHTGNPISQIARSDVFKTRIGYEWKFTNVQTGQSYKIETDKNFKDVQVKRLTSISDF